MPLYSRWVGNEPKKTSHKFIIQHAKCHCRTVYFLDQELSSSSSRCCCWGDLFKKAQGCVVSSRIGMKFGQISLQVGPKYQTCTDWRRFSVLLWRHTFKMAAMTLFHTEKCCHLVRTHEASGRRVRQFLIHSTFVIISLRSWFRVYKVVCWSGWSRARLLLKIVADNDAIFISL